MPAYPKRPLKCRLSWIVEEPLKGFRAFDYEKFKKEIFFLSSIKPAFGFPCLISIRKEFLSGKTERKGEYEMKEKITKPLQEMIQGCEGGRL